MENFDVEIVHDAATVRFHHYRVVSETLKKSIFSQENLLQFLANVRKQPVTMPSIWF